MTGFLDAAVAIAFLVLLHYLLNRGTRGSGRWLGRKLRSLIPLRFDRLLSAQSLEGNHR